MSKNKSALFTHYNKVRHLPNVDKNRLNRAFGLAQSKRIVWAHDEHNSLLVKSSDGKETYRVNGTCQCRDYQHRTHACYHRLGRRLLQLSQENSQ